MREIKSTLFSYLKNKMGKLSIRNNLAVNLVLIGEFLLSLIYFVSYQNEFYSELRIILKNGKVG